MVKKILVMGVFLAGFGYPLVTLGFMSSTNFQIISDTIGVGGGSSTSTSFGIQDTFSTNAVGIVSSTSYRVMGGFETADNNSISLSIGNNSLSLGNLSSSAVNTANTTATVITDAPTGYTLAISAVTGTSLTAVNDGSVTAGSEEYGITTTGSQSLVPTDVAVMNGLQLASSGQPMTSVTTLIFKASISNATSPATYSQNITLSASTNP